MSSLWSLRPATAPIDLDGPVAVVPAEPSAEEAANWNLFKMQYTARGRTLRGPPGSLQKTCPRRSLGSFCFAWWTKSPQVVGDPSCSPQPCHLLQRLRGAVRSSPVGGPIRVASRRAVNLRWPSGGLSVSGASSATKAACGHSNAISVCPPPGSCRSAETRGHKTKKCKKADPSTATR